MQMYTWPWLLILLVLGGTAALHAQQRPSVAYSSADGLPHDNIFSITQDPFGFLWIGTELGLSRFDGQTFQYYDLADGLTGFTVTNLMVDADTNLWVGCYEKGITVMKLSPQGATFVDSIQMALDFYLEPNRDRFISGIKEKSLIELELLGDSLAKSPFLDSYHALCGTAYATNDSTRWLLNIHRETWGAGKYQVVEWNSALGIWEDSVLSINLEVVLPPNALGVQWAGGDAGLYEIDHTNGLPKAIHSLPGGAIARKMVALGPRHFWIITRQGELLDWNDGQVTRIDLFYGWSPTRVTELYLDPKAGVWVGTYGQGLWLVNPAPTMETYTLEEGLPDLYVQTVRVDTFRDVIWAGTVNGLTKVQARKVSNWTEIDSKIPRLVRDIWPTASKVWVGVPSIRSDDLIASLAREVSIVNATSLIPFPNGNLLTGAFTPLGRFYQKAQDHGWDIHDFYLLNTPPVRSNAFYPDTTQMPPGWVRLWLTTQEGLYSTPVQWDQIKPASVPLQLGDSAYTQTGVNPGGAVVFTPHPTLQGLKCFEVLRDTQGQLWVATDRGLFHCMDETCEQLPLGPEKGGDHISAICLDHEQRLWAATYGGLYAIEPNRQDVLYFGQADGLPSHTLHDLDYNPADHTLWIGSSQGLTHTQISHLLESRNSAQPAPTHLTELRIGGRALVPEQLTSALPYDLPSLQVQFSSPLYRQTHRLRYRYRLNRARQPGPWQSTRIPEVNFSQLAAGNYHFEAQASLDGLVWGAPATWRFSIATPWYQQWWWYLLAGLLGAGAIVGTIYWYLRRYRHKEGQRRAQEQQMARLRHQAMTAMLSPHFVFNALQSIQQYIRHHHKAEADEYLLKFAQLIRLNMDSTAQQLVPLREELHRLQLYIDLESLRLPMPLHYSVHIDPELAVAELLIPGMLLQPYLENALWHGFAGLADEARISVEFHPLPGHRLQITLLDNGMGLHARQTQKQGQTHKSRGTQITRERLAYLEHLTGTPTEVSIQDRHALGDSQSGTRVRLILPLLRHA